MAQEFYEMTVRVTAAGLPTEVEYTETFAIDEGQSLAQVWEAWLKAFRTKAGDVAPKLVRLRLLPLKR